MQYATPLAMAAFEADRAFAKVTRERRRDSLTRRLFRRCAECARLAVYDTGIPRGAALPGVREIPLDAIAGSLEPGRAADFDHAFRPTERARNRWVRVWQAAHRGDTLPPICVVPVGDAYAIQDGHHRVSVALARGNATIAAVVA
jgi:hypothetical protein